MPDILFGDKRTAAYWGRNRSGTQIGVGSYDTPTEIVLMPINSKGDRTTAAQIEVPKADLPAFIKLMESYL
jgi:hypothetical protein